MLLYHSTEYERAKAIKAHGFRSATDPPRVWFYVEQSDELVESLPRGAWVIVEMPDELLEGQRGHHATPSYWFPPEVVNAQRPFRYEAYWGPEIEND